MHEEPAYFLGIDGGGTGCRARLVDASGTVLAEAFAGPASLRSGAEAAWAALMSAASDAIGHAGLDDVEGSIHAAIGVAGLSRRDAREGLVARPHVFASLQIVGDGAIACLGAHAGNDGGVVIAGTGSVAFGYVRGKEIRLGGYGFPLSDAGSGADLGLAMLRLALRAHDGLEASTPLLAEILAQFDADPARIVDWMDRAAPTDYAALAPIVARFAERRDPVACALMTAAAAAIAEMVTALTARGVPAVALMGGLAPVLEQWLPAAARQHLTPPRGDALDGALALARKHRNAISGKGVRHD